MRQDFRDENSPVKKSLILRPPTEGGGVKGRNAVRDFIYGCWCNGRRIGGMQMPPLMELYVATTLKNAGIPAVFMDADLQPEDFDRMRSESYRDIGTLILLSSTQSFASDARFMESLKKSNPDCKTILFGSHSTFMPEYCLRCKDVDFIVQGEPEETILDIVENLDKGADTASIPGTGLRDGVSIKINPPREFADLDSLPIPDRSMLPRGVDYFNPVIKRVPYTTAMTSRGCPYRCIFCTAPTFFGKRARFRSAASVLEEIRVLVGQGYREIFFRDETFTAYKKRNVNICETMLSEKIDVSWIANARADTVDEETLLLMRRAGCHMIKIGIETADNGMLATYGKGTTVELNERAIRMARKAGLETHAHMVFGGPGETPETIEKTIRFAVRMNPTTATFGILTPFPGTELFDTVAKKHPEIKDGSESTMALLHTTGFYSKAVCGLEGEYLSRQIKKAYRRFYLRPKYIIGRLLSVTSPGGFFRLAVAGSNVLKFAATGEK